MKKHTIRNALIHAFPVTIPVLLGYLFVGIAFGMLLQSKGFNFLWAILMSVCIYAGSMQFVAITFLTGGFSLLSVALMTLMINIRHMFYGLTMLDRFKDVGRRRKAYMIFALTDETYSLYCGAKVPEGVDRNWFFFFIALLDQLYWITGSVIGSIAGSLIPFNTKGIDFAMTALFVVILIEQLKSSRNPATAIIGAASAVLCILLFGGSNFILPSMLVITLVLTLFKRSIGEAMADKSREDCND
jgi:4-azaleucine resistance transporter AzlC